MAQLPLLKKRLLNFNIFVFSPVGKVSHIAERCQNASGGYQLSRNTSNVPVRGGVSNSITINAPVCVDNAPGQFNFLLKKQPMDDGTYRSVRACARLSCTFVMNASGQQCSLVLHCNVVALYRQIPVTGLCRVSC